MKSHGTCKPIPYVPGRGDGFWVNTDVLEQIQRTHEHSTDLLLLYCGLSRIMSDEQSRSFARNNWSIGSVCCLSPRVVEKGLTELQRIGVIHVEPTAPHTITLLGEVRL
jgi:hypothetical protein